MHQFLVGHGCERPVVVVAEGPESAAKKYAAEHEGGEDIFVNDAEDDAGMPPTGTWQGVRVFPRNCL